MTLKNIIDVLDGVYNIKLKEGNETLCHTKSDSKLMKILEKREVEEIGIQWSLSDDGGFIIVLKQEGNH